MKKWFTLIEFVIYIGIAGTALVVTGAIGLNILFGKAKLGAVGEVSYNARFAMEKISERVRNAQAINSPAIGTSGTSLSLKMADTRKNPTVFDVVNNRIRIKEGSSGIPTELISDETNVASLLFSNVSYVNTPGAVRVELSLEHVNLSGRPEYNASGTFYTNANIRKK